LRARGAAGDPRRRLPPRRRSRLGEIAEDAGIERKGDLREEDKERERKTVNRVGCVVGGYRVGRAGLGMRVDSGVGVACVRWSVILLWV
jgi:hypothetical protein